MTKAVILTEQEWKMLPVKLGQALARHSQKPYGFVVAPKESGEPITDRLDDWFVGTVALLWGEVVESIQEPDEPPSSSASP